MAMHISYCRTAYPDLPSAYPTSAGAADMFGTNVSGPPPSSYSPAFYHTPAGPGHPANPAVFFQPAVSTPASHVGPPGGVGPPPSHVNSASHHTHYGQYPPGVMSTASDYHSNGYKVMSAAAAVGNFLGLPPPPPPPQTFARGGRGAGAGVEGSAVTACKEEYPRPPNSGSVSSDPESPSGLGPHTPTYGGATAPGGPSANGAGGGGGGNGGSGGGQQSRPPVYPWMTPKSTTGESKCASLSCAPPPSLPFT